MGELDSIKWQINTSMPFCPICGSKEIGKDLINRAKMGYKVEFKCNSCQSLWMYRTTFSKTWIELKHEAIDGSGKELIGKQMSLDEMRNLSAQTKKDCD